jgi:hypothetical protein
MKIHTEGLLISKLSGRETCEGRFATFLKCPDTLRQNKNSPRRILKTPKRFDRNVEAFWFKRLSV